ncbi:RNA recognition motif domain, partial [Dillenia turbinata]
MDDMAAYYQPPPPPPGLHNPPPYPYYHLPPPPPAPPATAATGVTHQYHPQPPPPPQFVSYTQPPYPSLSSSDQVRTLFIAGLPEDVKPREIYNLFREFPGYESSHLRRATLSTQPFAFATFRDQQSALAAIHALNGMVFDLERESTLYIDLAKSNSRSKRSRTDEGRFGQDKRAKTSPALLAAPTDSGIGSVHLPGMGNSAHNTTAYPSTQSYGNVVGRAAIGAVASKLSNSAAPPCPTLFVANLGPTCSEQELIQVFSRLPGFLKLKMQHSYGAPVAFVDFQDTTCSTGALNSLQGTVLYSSPIGEGMRLEYPFMVTITFWLCQFFFKSPYVLLNKKIKVCKITDGIAEKAEV